MAALFGRCVYKGNCELNCQVFVSEDGGNSASSVCLACKHLAAFHTQGTTGNSVSVASFTRPPVVETRKEKQRQAYTGSQCGFCGCVALSEPSNYSFALTSMSFRDLPLL